MTVRMVKEEDPFAEAQAPALKLVAPMEPEALPPPVEVGVPVIAPEPVQAPSAPAPGPSLWQAAAIQALGVVTALAEILSIRFALILTIIASALLTAFAETRSEHQLLAVVAAALFSIPALLLMVALALRKG